MKPSLPATLLALFAATLLALAGCATVPAPLPPPKVTLAIDQIDRGVLIWLPNNFLFEFGKADINEAEAAPYLDRVAQLLKEKTQKAVSLEGHTDSIGSDAANQTLSEQRALAVRNALVGRGVAAERISTVGYGKSRPLAPNDSELGRRLNRRVELIVLDETVEHITKGEPANAFEAAFDKLRRELDQPLPSAK
jgi:outer membrane protein OmpA-like peptidoglycan-associated protein